MDLLAIGGAFLRDKLKQSASTEITFKRGDDTIQVFATRGQSSWDSAASDQSVTQLHTSDYIMAANQFDDFGLPEEGDLIVDFGKTFELLPVNGGQFFRYSDSARTIIRVHTKQIA